MDVLQPTKKRKTRVSFKKHQTELLVRIFHENIYPDNSQVSALADEFGRSTDEIRCWFQNHRSSVKQERRKAKMEQPPQQQNENFLASSGIFRDPLLSVQLQQQYTNFVGWSYAPLHPVVSNEGTKMDAILLFELPADKVARKVLQDIKQNTRLVESSGQLLDPFPAMRCADFEATILSELPAVLEVLDADVVEQYLSAPFSPN